MGGRGCGINGSFVRLKTGGQRFWRNVSILLIGFCVLLVIVRWTLRDSRASSAVLFYVGQPIVISGLLAIAALGARRVRRRRLAIGASVAALAFAAVWAAQSFRFGGHPVPSDAHRVVVWNVMSGRFGWERVYETLESLDADVIVMVEAWEDETQRDALRSRYLEGYSATSEHAGLVIFSRSGLSRVEFDRLAGGGRYLHAEVLVDGNALGVLAVDVESDPRRFRKYPLVQLAVVAQRYRNGPLLIAGDFNTPPDSMHFAAMRSDLRNGFEMSGGGYAPTWPSFAPVIALDQIWVNAQIDAYRCWGDWTLCSDHRPVIVEFGIRAGMQN